MTLPEAHESIAKAIRKGIDNGGSDAAKRITEIMTATIDATCYRQVLALLGRRDQSIVFTGPVTLDPPVGTQPELLTNLKALTISGTASILGRDKPTKIALTEKKDGTRKCVVEVGSFKEEERQDILDAAEREKFVAEQKVFTLSHFENKKLLTLGESVAAGALRDEKFAVESFEANSDTRRMKISGTLLRAGKVRFLDDPLIELEVTELVLETFLFQDWTEADVRLAATGTFQLDDRPVTAIVELPVGKTGKPGLWRVTLTNPVGNINPVAVTNWLKAGKIFEQAPAEIRPPETMTADLLFTLRSLTLEFSLRPLGVASARVVISINRPWKIVEIPEEGDQTALVFQLTDIALNVEVIGPLTSPAVLLWVTGQLEIGKTTLAAVITLNTGSREGAILFSSLKEFSLEDVARLPGASAFENYELPADLETIKVNLIELGLVFSLDAPIRRKLRSIQLTATTKFEWNLIPGIFQMSNPELSLELRNPLDRATQCLNARFEGTFAFLGNPPKTDQSKHLVNFEMERVEGRWILAAKALDQIPLDNVFGGSVKEERLGVDFPEILPASEKLAALTLSGLQARYATETVKHPSEFSFTATVVKISEFKLGNIAVRVQSLSVELFGSKTGAQPRETSMTLKGAFVFDTVPLSIAFNYQRGRERSWRVMIEALGFRGEYSTADKIAKIDLGNRNIGEILREVYSLVEPGVTIRLPEPWNELERISLQGASLIFDFENRSFGVTYEFQSEVPLVFARLKKIGINYAGGRSVRMTVEGQLFNEASDRTFSFDPRNPGPLPLPATKAAPIDLRFLALGQRLRLKTNEKIPEIKRVRDGLGLMQQAFSKDNPSEILLAKNSGLTFDPQSGLLLGADFSLLDTLSTALVFNDGVVAGISLCLSGARARYFRGLDFEILYKKVAEGIGVYQTEVRLPDSIRQIELGAVSMAIPELALEIYTNGNFRVDLGFPRNNDFSRSFQLQVFPYLGKGGFYFARLEGTTAPRLPADYDPRRGKFDPVLAFGLGLSIGVGKSINRGVLAAELSVTFEGIVEGLLAFFTGELVNGKPVAPDSLYYWAQGTIGIVGRIRGRASFSVITAEVSLVVESRIGIMLESFRPLMLTFTAAVIVDLVVKIGSGWLSVDIYCSFSTTISERLEFPVRNPGLPAWAPQPGAPARMSQRTSLLSGRTLLADRLAARESAPQALAAGERALPAANLAREDLRREAPRPLPEMTWNPIEVEEPREELRLLFRPQFTVTAVDGVQTAHCVALLFLKSVGTANKEDTGGPIAAAAENPVVQETPSDFDRLAEAMLLWCINSLLNRGTLTGRSEILQREVSVEDLESIYRVLTCRPDGAAPFTGAEVIDFLRMYFDIVIQAQRRPSVVLYSGPDSDPPGPAVIFSPYGEERPQVAIFPMIPDLRLEARLTVRANEKDPTQDFDLLHYSARFDQQTVVPSSYHREIAEHFKPMAAEFRSDVEKAADDSAADPPPQELSQAGGRSVAELVFEDYFLMIARDVVQSSLDLMKTRSHSHTTGNETLDDLASCFGVSIERIASDNRGLFIGAGVAIQIGGTTTTTTGDDSFAAIAARFGERSISSLVEEIGRANAFVPRLLTAGITITAAAADTTAEVEYAVKEDDTLDSVSRALRLEGGAGELVSLTAWLPGYLNSGIRLLVPIYARRQTAGRTTVADLAEAFTGIGDSKAKENLDFARDLGALNAYVKDLIPSGTLLMVSGIPYAVQAGETLASIAAKTSTPMEILTPMEIIETNRFETGILNEDIEITIPPTSRSSGDNDTLQSVATELGVPVGLLAATNSRTPGFLASKQQLSLPSIKVETLVNALPKQKEAPIDEQGRPGERKPSDLAGLVSRFMLPGMRLPRPSSLLKDERNLWSSMTQEGAPLYAMTGQQFKLPKFGKQYVRCTIDLIPPEDGPDFQYVMAKEKERNEPAEDEEAERLTIELEKEQELEWIDALCAADLQVTVRPFEKIRMSNKDATGKNRRRFALSNRIALTPAPHFSQGDRKNPSDVCTVWMLPEGLRRVLAQPPVPLPTFMLEVGSQKIEDGEVTFDEASQYSWATALNVRIGKTVLAKPPPASSNPTPAPKLSEMAYEIDGVDAEGVLLLEEILRRAGPKSDESFIKEVRILYPSKANDGSPALASKNPTEISAFLLQTNLSTLSGPRGLRAPSLAPAAEPVVPNLFETQKLQTLRLLWQASVVRSGGYYLFYRTKEPAGSFPPDIFSSNVTEITILVIFDFKKPGQDQDRAVLQFVNRVVVGDKRINVGAKLFATSLDLSVTQPTLPPGHTGFVVRRDAPIFPNLALPNLRHPTPHQQLEFLYSLLGCRVAQNDSFRESIEVPADGPDGSGGPNVWQYTKVIPAFKFLKQPFSLPNGLGAPSELLPDPRGNPYQGVGQELLVGFDWLDGFGNKTPWTFRDANPRSFPVRLGYTDELIGVERWPAVSAGYSISELELSVTLDFDVSRYTPHTEGQGSFADAKRVAKADLEVFRRIFYQLTGNSIRVSLHTTLDKTIVENKPAGEDQNIALDSTALVGFIAGIIRFLTSIAAPGHEFRSSLGRKGESLDGIALHFDVDPREARRLNPGLADILVKDTVVFLPHRSRLAQRMAGESLESIGRDFGVSTSELRRLNPGIADILKEDTKVVLPDLVFPAKFERGRPLGFNNGSAYYPLIVKLVLERVGKDVVHEEFANVPAVKSVAHEIEPLSIVAGNSSGRVMGRIRDFAEHFERLFSSTKLATGLARASDVDTDSRNRLWVVRIGSETSIGVKYEVQSKQQYFFAPTPLATTLLSGKNQEGTKSYVGIDLDEWARRFLAAIDTFFLPQYAMPAYILKPEHCETIMKAKSDIAELIANSVEGIAEGTGGDREQAKQLLRQRMLVSLSAAYDVDTIVQIGVNVKSPFKKPDKTPETRPDYAPKFYGQPVAKLPKAAASNDPPEGLDFTLSTAKIPLVDYAQSGDKLSYLTFLFDSEKVEPEQTLKLKLSYNATALECEISDIMPGVKDFKSSSWLTFIIPEKVIPHDKAIEVSIPIPIRASPIPPAVEKQAVGSAYPDRQDLKLEETRDYAYSYQYSRMRSARDLVYTSPRFNSVKPGQEAKREAAAQMDLFQALASFDGTWDAIRQDLLGTLPELKSANTPKEVEMRALNALKAFAQLASLVATAWKTWNEKEMPPVGPPEPGDRYKYEQKQVSGVDDYVISETSEKESAPWQITVRKCNGHFDAPIPAIEIKDWEQVEIEPANPNERRFQFEAKGTFMTEKDVKQKLGIDNRITRAVVFKNTAGHEQKAARTRKQATLDILNKENAWPELRITRNETLFGDVACAEGGSLRTNPSFVYHTPWVRFAEILTPRLESDQMIDIAKLSEKPGKNLDAAAKRSLKDHLGLLFKRLFESVKKDPGDKTTARRIQLACRYQYDLNEPSKEADLLVITLPIVMAPPFDFNIPDGKNETADFIQSLSEAIKNWLDDRHPSGKNARFVFDISVYSSIGEAKLPVYRASSLQLSLKDIKEDSQGT